MWKNKWEVKTEQRKEGEENTRKGRGQEKQDEEYMSKIKNTTFSSH